MKKSTQTSTLSVAMLGLATVPAVAQEKPNVVIIMTDQQSYNMMSCAGNTYLNTPNMDYIASQGYSFGKTYCANPVSTASRFAIFTGHRSSELGVRENTTFYDRKKVEPILEQSAMGNLFRRGGYETLYSGKMHLYGTKDASNYGFELHGDNPYNGPAEYAEKALAEKGATPQDKPFLMVLSFLNPHDICMKVGVDEKDKSGDNEKDMEHSVEPTRLLNVWNALSPAERLKQLPPRAKNTSPIDGEVRDMVAMNDRSRSWNEDQWKLYGWMYYRLTESVDAQVGRVLEALRKSGLEKNTIVVFTSDHGELNGAHNLNTKNCMFEECQRVPFIIYGKGIKKNYSDNKTLVCNGTDMIPTICDLAGVAYPSTLPGISLKPYLTGQGKTPDRKYIVTENYNGYQITDGRYKLSVYELPGNPTTLTDIVVNPGETLNFTNNKSYASIKKELMANLMSDLSARGLAPLQENRSISEIRKGWKEIRDSRKGGGNATNGGNKAKGGKKNKQQAAEE